MTCMAFCLFDHSKSRYREILFYVKNNYLYIFKKECKKIIIKKIYHIYLNKELVEQPVIYLQNDIH